MVLRMWYVVQVQTGREEAMATLITKVVPQEFLYECFSPCYATERKVHGMFEPCIRTLLPGYVIAGSNDPQQLDKSLRAISEFTHVLTMGGKYVPLDKSEAELIDAYTTYGNRVVPMSQAIKDGDHIVITEGPLVGHEGFITSIDRRKSRATVQLNLCGRSVNACFGLAVLSSDKRVKEDLCVCA